MIRGTSKPFLLFAAVALAACGGGDKAPAGSSSVPTPAPTPAPTPVAAPTPTPLGQCSLPIVTAPSRGCSKTSPAFLSEVDTAINRLVQQEPQIFDLNEQLGPGGYRVRSAGAYYVGVLRNLEAMGLCAAFDGEEVQVKNTNDFSDQYHILISSGHVRRGPASYRVTCFPAAFPTEPAPALLPRGDCSLPSSREVACSRDEPHYLAEVEAAITRLAQARPDIVEGDTVRSPDAYYAGVVANLREVGFCAFFDGEEIQMKRHNDFSDHFHIMTSNGKVRRGTGAYRSSCYPASF
jgi:hypothetical protein